MNEAHPFVQAVAPEVSRIRRGFEMLKAKETVAISRFPDDCCNHATHVLALRLLSIDIPVEEMSLAIATVPQTNDRHCWLRVRDADIDITADQFGQSPTIVSRSSAWHQGLQQANLTPVDSGSIKSKRAATGWLDKILQLAPPNFVGPNALLPGEDSWLFRVAVHETGHAIYAAILGLPITSVEIRPRELLTDPGDTQVEFQDDSPDPLYFAAGAAAEELIYGDAVASGLRDDRIQHSNIAEASFESSVEIVKQMISADLVRSVAKSLYVEMRLTDEDVYRKLDLPIKWE